MQSLSKHPLLVVVGFPQWFCLEKSQLRKAKLAHTEFMCFLFDAAICAHLSHTHTPYIWMKVTRWTWTCLNWYYLGCHKSFSQRWHVFSPRHACSCMWGIPVKLFSVKYGFRDFPLGPQLGKISPIKILAPLTVCLCCSPIWNHFGIHVGVNLGTFWNTIYIIIW